MQPISNLTPRREMFGVTVYLKSVVLQNPERHRLRDFRAENES